MHKSNIRLTTILSHEENGQKRDTRHIRTENPRSLPERRTAQRLHGTVSPHTKDRIEAIIDGCEHDMILLKKLMKIEADH